jgi:hypothetical protein
VSRQEEVMFARWIAALLLGLAATLVTARPAAALDIFEGQIVSVEKSQLTVQVPGEKRTFFVGLDAMITFNGQEARLADLKPRHMVTVTAERTGSQFIAKIINAKPQM